MSEIETRIIQEITKGIIPEGLNCPYCKYYIVKNKEEHISSHLGHIGNKAIRLSIEIARKERIKDEIDWLESSRNWLTFEDRGQEAITKRINQLKQSLEEKK